MTYLSPLLKPSQCKTHCAGFIYAFSGWVEMIFIHSPTGTAFFYRHWFWNNFHQVPYYILFDYLISWNETVSRSHSPDVWEQSSRANTRAKFCHRSPQLYTAYRSFPLYLRERFVGDFLPIPSPQLLELLNSLSPTMTCVLDDSAKSKFHPGNSIHLLKFLVACTNIFEA